MQQVQITNTMWEEVMYFAEDSDITDLNEELIMKKNSMGLLMKRTSDTLSNAIDDVVAQMVYGNMRKPPGDENCPYQKLLLKKEEEEIPGIWTPPNSLCKAMSLKWFFPNVSEPCKLPEKTSVPPHLVLCYDAFKYREVMELSEQFPGSIMKYGFFTTDIPGNSELITKTVEKFEKKLSPTTYEEKIVIQLAKNPDWLSTFIELGPSYMSPDTVQGEEDAKAFFPPTYDIPEEVIMAVKKKPKRKVKSKFVAVVGAHANEILQDKETTTETGLDGEEQTMVEDNDGQIEDKTFDGDDEDGEDAVEEIDKATSPMDEASEANDGPPASEQTEEAQ